MTKIAIIGSNPPRILIDALAALEIRAISVEHILWDCAEPILPDFEEFVYPVEYLYSTIVTDDVNLAWPTTIKHFDKLEIHI